MIKYIMMVFTGACSFGILSTFVKLAYRQGYTAAQISFVQAFAGMIALWILVFLSKKKTGNNVFQGFSFISTLPVLLTGVTIGLTTYVYYLAVQYIPASMAIVLLMQFTWIGILLDWLLFSKQPTHLQVLVLCLILTGTVLASGLSFSLENTISSRGIIYALGSALLYAIYIVANSKTGSTIPALSKGALMMSGSTAGIFLVNAQQLLVLASDFADMNLLKWAVFLALFGTIIPPLLFARGIPKVGASLSAIIMTVELPVAITCSHLILKEEVSGLQWIGVGLMLLAMMLLHVQNLKRSRKPVNA